MKTRLAIVIAAILASHGFAQTSTSMVTRALEPSERDLDRLNLTVSWRLYLPVGTSGDGVATVQPIEDQVFVQMKSGLLFAVQSQPDPKTFRKPGDIVWKFKPERVYGTVYPLAANARDVFVVQGQVLTILDRLDGKIKYTTTLASTASAGPSIDETTIYIPLTSNRIVAYSHTEKILGYKAEKQRQFPDPIQKSSVAPQPTEQLSSKTNRSPSTAGLQTLRPPFKITEDYIDFSPSLARTISVYPPYRAFEGNRAPSLAKFRDLRELYTLSERDEPTRIKYYWEMFTGGVVDSPPIIVGEANNPDTRRVISSTGRTVFTARREGTATQPIASEYHADAAISAPIAYQGDNLYVATSDLNFVALSLREIREPSVSLNSLPKGKFTAGGPVINKPIITEEALYVVGTRWGLIRLKKGSVEPMWTDRTPDGRNQAKPTTGVQKILAVNSTYVYALSDRGALMVIDARRGHVLSSFDISAFNIPITNEYNDRLYLAANNGLLVCIHEKGRLKPELLVPVKAPPKVEEVPAEKKEEPKKEEPKKEAEEKKEEPKKKEPAKKEVEEKKDTEDKPQPEKKNPLPKKK